ncbi:MAG: cupredoxin domain-containing protein [Pseudonocardia sediminis]
MLADSWTTPITTTSGSWRGLLMFCAGATLVATVALQAVGRFVGFPSLVVLGLAMLVGLALLRARGRRRRRAGAVVVGVFSLVNNVHAGLFLAVLSAPASDPLQFVTCTVTWAASLLAVPVSVVAFRRPDGGGRGPVAIRQAFLIVTVLAVLVGSTLYLAPAVDQARPGDLRVARERTGWGLFTDRAGRVMAPAVLTAEPGPVAIAVTNTDPLVGATFDIDELDVQVRVAPGSTVRVVVDAPAGRYRYYDDTFLADGVLEVG